MNDKEKDLLKQVNELKQLLKDTLFAMCSYRAQRGHCSICPEKPYCSANTLIPKIEKILKIKHEIEK